KIAIGAARDIHLCLISDAVCHRTDRADVLALQMTDETREPARWDERVVVEEDKDACATGRDSLVAGARKSEVLRVENRANPRSQRRKLFQVLDRAIARRVVDNNDLTITRVRE